MKDYKRLTFKTLVDPYDDDCEETENATAASYDELLNRLTELEDKIESGTLVEIPCKCGDNAVAVVDTLAYSNAILNVELKGLAYIVKDENGDITFQHISRIFKTEAEAKKTLKEVN